MGLSRPRTKKTSDSRTFPEEDMKALAAAFEVFTRTTQTMEESYRRLEARIQDLDQELAEKHRELALTTDYLKSILESMSDGVVAVDPAGVITTFNRAASEVLGYPAEAVVGRPFREVFGREFAVPGGHQLMELKTRDGRSITVSERDSPMADRDRHRIGTVKVFQDLTELRELRKKVRQKERLAAVGEMAARVAHEIRNPLGGIRGFASLLARDLKHDETLGRLVEKILEGAKDLERVVEELLEFTRPFQLRLRLTPCAEVVEAALGFLDWGDRAVVVVNEVDPSILILADPDRMRQVFLNILLNAVQSIAESGEVHVTAQTAEDHVQVRISDTGCGMTPEQVEQVFSPFFTTKEKGTGLGMAIAGKIVETHGGHIEVSSELGKGTRVSVRLPRPD